MSHRTILQRRAALLAAASLAGLGFAASPALAGSDGDAPPAIEQPPAPPPPTPLPLPEAPAPTPTQETAPVTPSGGTEGEQASNEVKKTTPKVSRQVAFKTTTKQTAGVTTIPTGSVQAGGGGTSLSPGTPAGAIGLAGGSLVLLLTSAGLAAGRRRGTSSI
jgi:hypothetical protein